MFSGGRTPYPGVSPVNIAAKVAGGRNAIGLPLKLSQYTRNVSMHNYSYCACYKWSSMHIKIVLISHDQINAVTYNF